MTSEDGVPRGADGRPLAKVSMGVAEKIGLPSYSSIDIQGWVTRYCEDEPQAIDETLRECVTAVEGVLATERVKALELRK